MNILSISMEVPRNLANLFELRLKKFKFPIEMLARTELSKDHPSGKKLSEVTSVTVSIVIRKKHARLIFSCTNLISTRNMIRRSSIC